MIVKNLARAICALVGGLAVAYYAGYKAGERYGTAITLGKVEETVINALTGNTDEEKKEETKEGADAE